MDSVVTRLNVSRGPKKVAEIVCLFKRKIKRVMIAKINVISSDMNAFNDIENL